jgi:hypothetical protein
MLARPSFAVAISLALVAPQAIEASPITYDFSGTFNQPINGSTQFSGTFTIDSNPTILISLPSWESGGVGENGADVSLTAHIGGQTIDFVNTSQNPENAMFEAAVLGTGEVTRDPAPPSVDFSLQGYSGTNDRMAFTLSFTRPGTHYELAELTSLASPSYTSSVTVNYDPGGQTQQVDGSLTSIELVSAPEPSMLAVFGVMAIAGMAHWRLRRS